MTATPLNDNHEFVVLACDGIWDVLTSQEVIDFIRPKLAEGLSPDVVGFGIFHIFCKFIYNLSIMILLILHLL